MKTKFNKNWNRSVQPRKQVKYRANAPNHILKTFMAAPLDKSLKMRHKRNSIEVRKDDEVKVMRGKYKGKQGKVLECDIKRTRVQIDGISKQKKSGDKVPIWFNPSKIKIISLYDKDEKRFKTTKKEEKEVAEKVEINKEKEKNAHEKK
ncbi:MAG: 50S ribosomal protein L24 [Candidatus Pacearchaeota archaeon]